MIFKIVIKTAIHIASLNKDSPSSLTIKWLGALTEAKTPLTPIGSVAPSAEPKSNKITKEVGMDKDYYGIAVNEVDESTIITANIALNIFIIFFIFSPLFPKFFVNV